MPALPRQRFGVVDVRDVADAHIRAMAALHRPREALPATGGRPDDHVAAAGREAIDGQPTTRAEFAAVAPPREPPMRLPSPAPANAGAGARTDR